MNAGQQPQSQQQTQAAPTSPNVDPSNLYKKHSQELVLILML